MLAADNIVNGKVRIRFRKLKRTKSVLSSKHLVSSPIEQGAEWVSHVNAVDQERHSVWLPNETSLKSRYPDLPSKDRIQDFANSVGVHYFRFFLKDT